jgi:predicted DCC family thiol-disulfide oxidoreductase YuxK
MRRRRIVITKVINIMPKPISDPQYSEIRMHRKSEHRRNEQYANKVIEELRTEIANAIRQQEAPESHV